MSASSYRAPYLAPSAVSGLNVPSTLALWAGRFRSRSALSKLDDAMLKDIGLTRAEAEAEARRPFWKA